MGFLLIINRGSGSVGDPPLPRDARRRLGDVDVVEFAPGVDVGAPIRQAVAEDRVVVAAGGDGTVNAVAQHVAGRGILGVIPGGTLNHFARDLGIDDTQQAFRVLQERRIREIDVGRANGRIFLNSAGMGIYPELVRERERREDRMGKWLAAAGGALRVMARGEPLTGSISADGDRRALFAWILFLGNNRFIATPGSVGTRERLDEGILDVRLLTVGRRRGRRPGMAWRMLRSRQWQSRRLVRTEARSVEVSLDGPPRLVSTDGEAVDPTTHLDVEIVPRGLRVVAPATGGGATGCTRRR